MELPASDSRMEGLDSENPDSDSEFSFETDHLALRGNKDYCELLKYIVKLEAQKVNCLKDIEDLSYTKNKALDEPLQFLKDLQESKLNFPQRQTIADMPNIDWSQYGIDTSLENEDLKKTNNDEFESTTLVRGRKFTDNKPDTFNQKWSCEEQTRLVELLEIYPEEPIEARRYKKIAEALGTRTPLQVMSRIQKYFAQLAKAGFPIPGKAPKGVLRRKNKSVLYKKSTFFPQLHVPVKMDDPYDTSEIHASPSTLEAESSEESMLQLLKAAQNQKYLDETWPVYQTKTRCVGCQQIGFLGARWTDNAGTDYCTDCVVKLLPPEKLIPIR